MPTKVGRKCKAYLNTGDNDSPTWVEIKRIPGIKVVIDKKKVELDLRESEWIKQLAGQKSLQISFSYNKLPLVSDSIFNALKDSELNDTPIQLAIMDGPIATTGTFGVKVFVQVFKMENDQGQAKPNDWSVDAELTEYLEDDAQVEPAVVTIA